MLTPLVLFLIAIGGAMCCCSTRSRRCSASPVRRTSSSPRTRLRSSACGRCTFSWPGCWTGSSPLDWLAAVGLVFIGVKAGAALPAPERRDSIPEVSTALSLAVIGVVLTIATAASVIRTRREPTARARAGALRRHERRADDDDAAEAATDRL